MNTTKIFKTLALFFFCSALFACSTPAPETSVTKAPNAPTPAATTAAAATAKSEGHEHSAPHGGALIELGEEFAHVELVLEPTTGKLTAYVLDGEAEKAVRLKQAEIEIAVNDTTHKLSGVANSLTGETASDTSEFSAPIAALKGQSKFSGTIKSVAIKGRTFSNVTFKFPEGSDEKKE